MIEFKVSKVNCFELLTDINFTANDQKQTEF